jgi:hypothetical protein
MVEVSTGLLSRIYLDTRSNYLKVCPQEGSRVECEFQPEGFVYSYA